MEKRRKFLNKELKDTNLDPVIISSLQYVKVNTIWDLVNFPKHKLEKVRSIGSSRLNEIKKFLMENDLTFVYDDDIKYNFSTAEIKELDIDKLDIESKYTGYYQTKYVNNLNDLLKLSKYRIKRLYGITDLRIEKLLNYFESLGINYDVENERLNENQNILLKDLSLLENSGLSNNTLNILSNNNIYTLLDIISLIRSEIYAKRGISVKSLGEIEQLLNQYDLEFIDETVKNISESSSTLAAEYALKYFLPANDVNFLNFYKINTIGDLIGIPIEVLKKVTKNKLILELHNTYKIEEPKLIDDLDYYFTQRVVYLIRKKGINNMMELTSISKEMFYSLFGTIKNEKLQEILYNVEINGFYFLGENTIENVTPYVNVRN